MEPNSTNPLNTTPVAPISVPPVTPIIPPAPRSNVPMLLVILGLVVALGAGALVYAKYLKQSPAVTNIYTTATSTEQISVSTINTNLSLEDQLIEWKLRYALLDSWRVRQVFRDPLNKNKFYFTLGDSHGGEVRMYDVTTDKAYKQTGYTQPTTNSLDILDEVIPADQEFRGVGITDNKFVFVQTSKDDSPGPCFSPWFYQHLNYIDLNTINPIKKTFTLPQQTKDAQLKEQERCESSLSESSSL